MATIPEQKSGFLGFNATLNSKTNPFIPSRDVWDMDGFYTGEVYSLVKRSGYSAFTQTGVTADAISGVFAFDTGYANPAHIVIGSSSGLYALNGTTMTAISFTSVSSTFTSLGSVTRASAAMIYDNMYIGTLDGPIRVVSGTSPQYPIVYRMGMGIPVSGTFAATTTTSAGVLSIGTYTYYCTFVNDLGQESNPIATSATYTTTTGNQIVISGIPTQMAGSFTDPQVKKRNLYRTAVNSTIPLYLNSIGNNTATTYTDNMADTSLGIAMDYFDNGLPPNFSIITIDQGYAYMTGIASTAPPLQGSRVYVSSPSKPACVNANYWFDLDPNDGDIITGLQRFLGTIIAFKQHSIWVLTGASGGVSTMQWNRAVNATGLINSNCVLPVPGTNLLAIMSPEHRFFFFDGTNCTQQATNLETYLFSTVTSGLEMGYTCYSQNQIRWILGTTANEGLPGVIVWYDYVQGLWGTTVIPSGVGVNSMWTMYGNTIVAGGLSNGQLIYTDSGSSDSGSDIPCSVTDRGHPAAQMSQMGVPIQAGNNENQKVFSHLFVYFKPTTTTTTLNMYGILDDPTNTPVSLGTVNTNTPSGVSHLHFNLIGRRMFVKRSLRLAPSADSPDRRARAGT